MQNLGKKFYPIIGNLQEDEEKWINEYNEDRSTQQ